MTLILIALILYLYWDRAPGFGFGAKSNEKDASPKRDPKRKEVKDDVPPAPVNPLDGCRHLYLDVGTNIGVQIRKVFEGESLYPESPVFPVLQKHFTVPREELCGQGFEPNPDHKKRLDTLEKRYAAVGWRVNIERGAASDTDGTTSFYLDRDDPGRQWGARITPMSFQKDEVKVKSINFARWFAEHVPNRKIPESKFKNASKPTVAMKLDVEGHEAAVLGPMLRLGLLCKIDLLLLEGVHLQQTKMEWIVDLFKKPIKGCPTIIVDMDDEDYGLDGAPWPTLGKGGKVRVRAAKKVWKTEKWPGFAPDVEEIEEETEKAEKSKDEVEVIVGGKAVKVQTGSRKKAAAEAAVAIPGAKARAKAAAAAARAKQMDEEAEFGNEEEQPAVEEGQEEQAVEDGAEGEEEEEAAGDDHSGDDGAEEEA